MKRGHVPPSTVSRAGNGWSQEEWPDGAHPGQAGKDVQSQLSQLDSQTHSPWPWQMRCLKVNWAGSRPFTTPQELLDTGSVTGHGEGQKGSAVVSGENNRFTAGFC